MLVEDAVLKAQLKLIKKRARDKLSEKELDTFLEHQEECAPVFLEEDFLSEMEPTRTICSLVKAGDNLPQVVIEAEDFDDRIALVALCHTIQTYLLLENKCAGEQVNNEE